MDLERAREIIAGLSEVEKIAAARFIESSRELLGAAVTGAIKGVVESALSGRPGKSTRCDVRPDFRKYPFISVGEACALTGLSKHRIYQLVSQGKARKGGVGIYYIDQACIVRAFAKQRRQRPLADVSPTTKGDGCA